MRQQSTQRNCERRYETDNTRLVGNAPESQHSHRGQNGYIGTGARIRTLLEWLNGQGIERVNDHFPKPSQWHRNGIVTRVTVWWPHSRSRPPYPNGHLLTYHKYLYVGQLPESWRSPGAGARCPHAVHTVCMADKSMASIHP